MNKQRTDIWYHICDAITENDDHIMDDPANEYDPDDPLGLSSGMVSCTMTAMIDPWEEATAEIFVQDGNGNWIVDEDSRNDRDMLIRSYRQWL